MSRPQKKATTAEIFARATELMKPVKEEILTAAWGETPPKENVACYGIMDQFIRQYLMRQFNPAVPESDVVSLDCSLWVVHSSVRHTREGANLPLERVKEILDRHAPPPGP